MPYAKDLRDPNVPWDKYKLRLARKEEQTKLIQEIMKLDKSKAFSQANADAEDEE